MDSYVLDSRSFMLLDLCWM